MSRIVAVCFAASLWVLPFALGSAACGDDSDADEHGDHGEHGGPHDHSKPVGPPSEAECPDDSTLTYENFAKDFFADYCLRCHSSKVKGAAREKAPADHNFDTYDEIDLLAMHIDQKAAAGPDKVNDKMPPDAPKPSLEERKKLGEWLACDLKE